MDMSNYVQPNCVNGISKDDAEKVREIPQIQEDIENIESDITGIQSDITDVQSDITGIQSDITGIQSDITGIQSDITDVQSDITDVQSDITGVQTDITDIQSDITEIQTEIESITGLGDWYICTDADFPLYNLFENVTINESTFRKAKTDIIVFAYLENGLDKIFIKKGDIIHPDTRIIRTTYVYSNTVGSTQGSIYSCESYISFSALFESSTSSRKVFTYRTQHISFDLTNSTCTSGSGTDNARVFALTKYIDGYTNNRISIYYKTIE